MDEPTCYEIRVKEHLDAWLTVWFGGLEIAHSTESGETIIRGTVVDQPALFGLLGKIRDLGLTLISVQRLSPQKEPTGPEKKSSESRKCL